MKKLLITGGAGFIGSNFIKYILNKYTEYKVYNIDKLTYAGNLDNLRDVEDNNRYTFIRGDISNREFVDSIFNLYDFDYVVNIAAESHVDRSIENSEVFIQTNVMGTLVLIDVAKKYWTIGIDQRGYPIYKENVRYIQISTDEVYGDLENKLGYFTEKTPVAPNSPYAASKASGDMLVRSYYNTYHFPINITRCANNYGAYQFPEKLIPLMIINCFNEISMPVYGDGMQVRDWIHVKDHCAAIDTVLHKGEIGEIYNIGGNNEKTNIEIVKIIINTLNKNDDLITYVKDRLGHDRRYAIDNKKITTELDWKPRYTFEEGIQETIQWYLENKDWWEKIY